MKTTAHHGGLWLVAAGVAVVILFVAFSMGRVIPAIGHAVLVPFNALLKDHNVNVLTTTGVNTVATTTAVTTATTSVAIIENIHPVATSTAPASIVVNQDVVHSSPQPSPREGRGGSVATGGPDLSVAILVSRPTYVQFLINNIGGKTIPAGWTFVATLPSSYVYTSPQQPALSSQNGFIYTLVINYPSQNVGYTYSNTVGVVNGTFTIVADPYGTTGDINRYNNSASVGI